MRSAAPVATPEPKPFHVLNALANLHELLTKKLDSQLSEWPLECRSLVPDLLRKIASEMEDSHDD
jgi:hypothetical protein